MAPSTRIKDMVALLADHLDKVIVTAERLTDLRFAPRPISPSMSAEEVLAEHARLREFLDGIRVLEMTLVARVDKARSWAREIKGRDGTLKLICSLFLTGTQALADVMAEIADPRLQDFAGAEQALVFLKSRALVPDHVATLDAVGAVGAGAATRIAGAAQLGALVELCTTFIDTLDVHYGVLAPVPEEAQPDTAAKDAATG